MSDKRRTRKNASDQFSFQDFAADEQVAPKRPGMLHSPTARTKTLVSKVSGVPQRQFWKDTEVAEFFNVTKATIWRWVKSEPGFPRPIKLAKGTTRWAIVDIEAYALQCRKEQGID